jgi:pimeloyl-ACP methyl ester carboxylesterase
MKGISWKDSGGSGAAVVFMHPASCDSRVWVHQEPAVKTAGLRFIAMDRRGYGKSEGTPGFAADDLEALRKHLQIKQLHLVGTAAGGIAAVDYALSYPQGVASLVIANSIVGVQDEEYQELGKRLRPQPHFNAMPEEFRELGPSYRAANPEGLRRWIEMQKAGHAHTPPPRPPAPPQTKNRITYALLETIRTPTLMITGDADLYMPPSVLRLLSKRIPNSKALVLAECGHSAYWEQPEAFNKAVLDFVKQN